MKRDRSRGKKSKKLQKEEAEVEQYMEIVVLIICAVIIVAGIVLIIWLLRNRYDNSNVVIHGGMDTGTHKKTEQN